MTWVHEENAPEDVDAQYRRFRARREVLDPNRGLPVTNVGARAES